MCGVESCSSQNIVSAKCRKVRGVSLLRVGTVLRLERAAWSVVKRLSKKATK